MRCCCRCWGTAAALLRLRLRLSLLPLSRIALSFALPQFIHPPPPPVFNRRIPQTATYPLFLPAAPFNEKYDLKARCWRYFFYPFASLGIYHTTAILNSLHLSMHSVTRNEKYNHVAMLCCAVSAAPHRVALGIAAPCRAVCLAMF